MDCQYLTTAPWKSNLISIIVNQSPLKRFKIIQFPDICNFDKGMVFLEFRVVENSHFPDVTLNFWLAVLSQLQSSIKQEFAISNNIKSHYRESNPFFDGVNQICSSFSDISRKFAIQSHFHISMWIRRHNFNGTIMSADSIEKIIKFSIADLYF